MAITKIEIEGHGEFKVKDDLLHRPKSYLKTFDKGRFKQVQFNYYFDYVEPQFQEGYDYSGQPIRIKVLEQTKK